MAAASTFLLSTVEDGQGKGSGRGMGTAPAGMDTVRSLKGNKNLILVYKDLFIWLF